nr:hypothetical protein [Pseudoalteromonas sp. WY3]
MLKKVASLFGGKSKNSASPKKLKVEEVKAYFNRELDACELIPKEKYPVVMQHLLHEQKLKAEDISLVFGVSTEKAREISAAIKAIYNKATITRAWDDNLIKSINAGIKKFSLCRSGTNEDCDWCKSQFGKELELNGGTKAMFENNCQCKPYRKSFIQPKVEF